MQGLPVSCGVCSVPLSLPLSALLLYVCLVACKYALISRFKGVFRGFWGFGVGLCCLRALRGLCGFCVREVFGGFRACGVFASILYLLPCFLSCCLCFPLVVVLCSGCLYLFSCVVFVVSFSLSDYTQKERARRVGASSLVLLWVVAMRLPIVRGLPAIPFRLLRGSVRKCSNVGGLRHNIGNQSR